MIDMSVFREELNKLAVNFGTMSGIEGKIEFFWNELKDVDEMVFRDACRSILQNGERFPRLKDFKEAISGAVMKLQSHFVRPGVDCPDCDGTGLISLMKPYGKWRDKELYGEYVFRCHCQAGREANSAIQPMVPKFTEGFISRDKYLEEVLS